MPCILILAYEEGHDYSDKDDSYDEDDYYDEDDRIDKRVLLEISPYNETEAIIYFGMLGHLSLKTMKLTTFRKQNLDTFDSMRNAIKKENLFSMNNSNNIAPSKSIIKADFHGTRVGTIAHIPANGVDKTDLFFQCNVSVYGAKGKNVTLIAYVDGPQQGVGLKNPNGHYTTPDGTVAISKTVQALENNEGTQWKQFLLILPFSELGLRNGDHVINVRWFASVDGMFIGNSGFQTIRFTKRNSDITNFRVDGGEA